MDEQGAYAATTYKNRFGSWTNAPTEVFDDVTSSSSTQSQPSNQSSSADTNLRRVSDDDLLADLQTLANELGHSPTSKDMREQGSHSVNTYLRHFGSWTDALAAADLDSPNQNKISDADLIADLHRLRDELGERPTSTDVADDGEYGLATYQRRFGLWSEAVAAAFDEPDA